MTNTKHFNSGVGENPLDEENIPINTSGETARLKSENTKLEALTKQQASKIDILNLKVAEQSETIQSLRNQIVQILASGDPEKAQMIEQIKKDILGYDPHYFDNFIHNHGYSSSWDEANKKA